ncbi:hypothetical protein [Halalkalicoccus ordinarius]|uniref:hypothetical protein n=1 Tax=Halalkalicoccus ordinarius TaxID=3116651 RepID=UPI00300E85B1
MTPVGYQPNLPVYAPDGYTFADVLRVGTPSEPLLAVVTTPGIAFIWGSELRPNDEDGALRPSDRPFGDAADDEGKAVLAQLQISV